MNKGKHLKGRLFNQLTKSNGTTFNLFYLLFIDDGAFIFNNKEQLIKGSELIYDHFKKFGLKMHIGENNIISKSEVMYFPPDLQTNTDQEMTIPIKCGSLKVSKNFTYLGVNINNELKDNTEIKIRTQKATAQMGALKDFFRNKHISKKTKYKIYMAIPLSTLLWGSESWTLSNSIIKKLFPSSRCVFNLTYVFIRYCVIIRQFTTKSKIPH